MKCTKCGSELSESLDICTTCWTPTKAPNVRFAEKPEQQDALNARYNAALAAADTNGTRNELNQFDDAMRKTSAVINMDISDLFSFMTKDKGIISSYQLMVEAESRIPAVFANESQRCRVEATLFAHYGKRIRYAALSYDKTGLKSYAPYSMTLRDITIEDRATLLENNSYPFLNKHGIIEFTDIPAGYWSTWKDRCKLAVAKLNSKILSTTTEDQYAKILLESEGKRETDEFIEVHIYGGFDNKAIEAIKGVSNNAIDPDKAMLTEIKKSLTNKGSPSSKR
ncbi:MAG: hypothetical protein L7F78_07355 [Syntrophales bacterium LBB04]|nr:hypothetical protein [Syntrophales bacterium LBB04]